MLRRDGKLEGAQEPMRPSRVIAVFSLLVIVIAVLVVHAHVASRNASAANPRTQVVTTLSAFAHALTLGHTNQARSLLTDDFEARCGPGEIFHRKAPLLRLACVPDQPRWYSIHIEGMGASGAVATVAYDDSPRTFTLSHTARGWRIFMVELEYFDD